MSLNISKTETVICKLSRNILDIQIRIKRNEESVYRIFLWHNLLFIILVMWLKLNYVFKSINLYMLEIMITWNICNTKYTERTDERKYFFRNNAYRISSEITSFKRCSMYLLDASLCRLFLCYYEKSEW